MKKAIAHIKKLSSGGFSEIHRTSEKYIGNHIVADFWGSEFNDTAENLLALLINASHVANATVLDTSSHQFQPKGATVLILLAESHISAHTWPEYDYIAFDIFTCGPNMKPEDALDYLKKRLKPRRIEVKSIKRGYNGK